MDFTIWYESFTIAITTFLASLCQLSSDAMRDGRQIPLLHIVNLQRATKGNCANHRGRTIHARLATELLAANK